MPRWFQLSVLVALALAMIGHDAAAQRVTADSPTQLSEAVTANDPDAIQTAVADGADVNARYTVVARPKDEKARRRPRRYHKATPLLHASIAGHERAVETLLEEGGDPNLKAKDGSSPLIVAASKGYEFIVHTLLKGGADPNVSDTTGTTPLMGAALYGNLETVRLLLKAGANPSPEGGEGTALTRALAGGQTRTAMILLENGADPNVRSRRGRTPLMKAAFEDNLEMVKRLLDAGADPNLPGREYGQTPLMLVADGFSEDEIARTLLEAGADPNARMGRGQTALMAAARDGAGSTVDLLLEYGATVDLEDDRGLTAIDHATASCEKGVRDQLLAALGQDLPADSSVHVTADRLPTVVGGAQAVRDSIQYTERMLERKEEGDVYIQMTVDADGTPRRLLIEDCGRSALSREALRVAKGLQYEPGRRAGESVPVRITVPVSFTLPDSIEPDPDETRPSSATLPEAVASGKWDALQRFLDNGVSPSVRFDTTLSIQNLRGGGDHLSFSRATPLHLAVHQGQLGIARALLEAGADPSATTDEGWSPLVLAARQNQSWLVRLLLAHGARVDATDNQGNTALTWMAGWGEIPAARALLSAGATPTHRNKHGESPLLFAIAGREARMAKILIDAGARPSEGGTSNRSPLQYALAKEHTEVATVLAAAGANPNRRNREGETPLMEAAYLGDEELVRTLLEAGAYPNIQDGGGRTALHDNSAYTGSLEIAKLLLEAGADPNVLTSRGETALMMAVENGRVELVRLLLEAGADPTFENSDGKQALDLVNEHLEWARSHSKTEDVKKGTQIRDLLKEALKKRSSSEDA